MNTLRRAGFLVLFFLFVTQSGFAAARSWEMDKAHSNIYFSIDHIFSRVHGLFNEFTAEVNFDPANLAESKFVFAIKTDSINTNIAKRDKHLQSADFFDAAKYPEMTFVSETITDAGNGLYQVAGKLTIKGESYDLILPLKLAGVKEHPTAKGKEVIGFNGSVILDRLAHKVGTGKFYDMGVVGKDVDVLVTLELLSEK
ncbi:MAG: polyisoprenoid-binding protein [Desulfofustis sp.]|nr:polyisoprenoid-binding protein [Desulfofustis sp.]